jgi:RES domain
MSSFRSADAYRQFAQRVRSQQRYILEDQDWEFLNALVEQAQKERRTILPRDNIFWRAVLDHSTGPLCVDGVHVGDIELPVSLGRMRPLKDKSSEGRANPKGIPYLYLSNRKEIAISEVRPWLGSYISVAEFRAVRDLSIADFSTDEPPRPHRIQSPFGSPPDQWDHAIWYAIDQAFREPVTPNDKVADYAPTQIIAEFFKSNRFHGLAYQSAFQEPGEQGHNIVLFDTEAVRLIERSLVKVTRIAVSFEDAGRS